ncbi:MAG TPA: hypothetical protein VFT35_09725 [Gaiellaceae bacterium]|nr:hypothetical protein [Gaiellaceae bacterium]
MRLAVATLAAGLLLTPVAMAGTGKLFFEDTIPSGKSTAVSVTTQKPASFRVLLRVPTTGRAKLFLLGKNAPKGGPLIDTKTYACEGAAGSFYCKGSYEPLPKGTYTWRLTWTSVTKRGPKMPAHVELTVRW